MGGGVRGRGHTKRGKPRTLGAPRPSVKYKGRDQGPQNKIQGEKAGKSSSKLLINGARRYRGGKRHSRGRERGSPQGGKRGRGLRGKNVKESEIWPKPSQTKSKKEMYERGKTKMDGHKKKKKVPSYKRTKEKKRAAREERCYQTRLATPTTAHKHTPRTLVKSGRREKSALARKVTRSVMLLNESAEKVGTWGKSTPGKKEKFGNTKKRNSNSRKLLEIEPTTEPKTPTGSRSKTREVRRWVLKSGRDKAQRQKKLISGRLTRT